MDRNIRESRLFLLRLAEGQEDILSLVRCSWAGSQKYAALTWSGDVHSSFRSMREQLQAGLSMGMAGIPWWTCDAMIAVCLAAVGVFDRKNVK